MNCHAARLRALSHRTTSRHACSGNPFAHGKGGSQSHGGAVARIKEVLYDLVDMTARERFEALKPRY
jgi:hypothetical protein